MSVFKFLVPIAAALSALPAAAQPTPEDYQHSITLRERQMYLTENVAEPAFWSKAANSFHYRKTVPGGFQFVTVDAATMAKRPAFDHQRMADAVNKTTGASHAALRLPFSTFRFTDDGQGIAIGVDGKNYVCGLTDYECGVAPAAIGRPKAFGVLRDTAIPADNRPRRSPDGRWEAFVENFNMAIRPVGSQTTKLLTTDGSEGNFYDPQTIAWSPDSAKLAAYRVRPGFRREIHRVESSPADQIEPRLITQLYPKPGDVIDLERPVIFHIASGRMIEVDNALFANPYQLSDLTWRADGKSLAFTYNQRGHAIYRLIEIDGESGTARAAVTETSDTFVYGPRLFHHDVANLGRELIWTSERDGWNHLYLFDGRTGRIKNQITKGDWVVREVIKVDDDKRQIWFAANGMHEGTDPYFQHYYRVDFDGRNLTRLTTADAYHDVSFSPDMSLYVDTYSRIDTPPVSELRRAADGSLVAEIERGDISKLLAAGWRAPETFVAKGRDGKTDIWGVIVRPRDFDPAKTYPVIENIYGAGFSNFVPKTFWPFGYHAGGDEVVGMQAQADLGFIVVQIDGMGTLHRSKAFHDVTWKNVGEGGAPDRILWHQAAAAKYDWYDIDRVGLYGGSLGGQNALGGLLFFPDFYKAAVAYNGCHDNRMDKISWNEQWMCWPVDDSYSRSSNVDNAWRLKGNIMLVVGELDMNVDPAASMQVANALIKAGKTFDLLLVPGGDHGVGRSEEPIDYIIARQYDFFVRHLQGVATPLWNSLTDATPPTKVEATS